MCILVCVKEVDIQSLPHVCASFYILIVVFLFFDNLNVSIICLLSIMLGQLQL